MDYRQTLEKLLATVIQEGGSDLHFSTGHPPTIRVGGDLTPLASFPVLKPEDTMGFATALLPPEDKARLIKEKQVDFSYAYGEKGRFRGNCFFQKGAVSVALRLVPRVIRSIAELNLPPVLTSFADRSQGFFLIVGPVGHGKTTTMAALVEHINQTRAEHIITIEDPIEFLFEPKKSLVDQREVRIDAESFADALTSVFREDINVLVVGEMRDPATISTAVTASETGHLVLSTLHTNNASQTIDRIINSFSGSEGEQIRLQLSGSLSGIFSQRLLPRISGGLVPAYELLINTPAVSNLIREKRTHEIDAVIETGSEQGMIDMNRSLADLVRRGEISIETAKQHSLNAAMLGRLL